MRTLAQRLAVGTLTWTLAAAPALAGELHLEIRDGRVTLTARDVPVRQILAEWAKVGQTRIVNAEKITGGPVTLQLTDVPERDALDVVLRSVSGYVAAPRAAGSQGPSLYDRILVLATSTPVAPPRNVASPSPSPFTQPPVPAMPATPQPVTPATEDVQDESPPAGGVRQQPFNFNAQPVPNNPAQQPQPYPGPFPPGATSPVPGVITAVPPQPGQPTRPPGQTQPPTQPPR